MKDAGVMVVAVNDIEGTLLVKQIGEGQGCGGWLVWRGTKVEMGTQGYQSRGERAEVLRFESKMEFWPGRLRPGTKKTIQPTLDATRVQLTQDMEHLHWGKACALESAVARMTKLTTRVTAPTVAMLIAAPKCPHFGMSQRLVAALAIRMEAPTQRSWE